MDIKKLSKGHIDNIIAMVNSFKLSTNTTTATTITIIPKGMEVKFSGYFGGR